MTCKECYNRDACGGYLPSDLDKDVWDLCAKGKSDEIPDIEDRCSEFKDKSLIVELPCKVGDTVYVITTCANVYMSRDDDYFTGTGAVECPFEHDCGFIDCSDDNLRIFETICTGFMFDHENITNFHTFFKDINAECSDDCWGKTVFLNREAAEKALKTR